MRTLDCCKFNIHEKTIARLTKKACEFIQTKPHTHCRLGRRNEIGARLEKKIWVL